LNVVHKVRIKFKVNVIDNACRVARAIHLMTNSRFAEGYNLIKEMQGGEFLTALRMTFEQEAMIKKLSDFRQRQGANESESTALLLVQAAEAGDQVAIALLATGALEKQV
jgi:hypothetical protein